MGLLTGPKKYIGVQDLGDNTIFSTECREDREKKFTKVTLPFLEVKEQDHSFKNISLNTNQR